MGNLNFPAFIRFVTLILFPVEDRCIGQNNWCIALLQHFILPNGPVSSSNSFALGAKLMQIQQEVANHNTAYTDVINFVEKYCAHYKADGGSATSSNKSD